MEFGILLARLLIGLGIAAHGAQKLFGWFGGPGLKGMGGYLESLGFHPGRWFAPAAGLAELVGGGLNALGFLGPAGPALLTPRERQILALLGEGRSNREIANILVISERTARTHVSNVLSKLNLTSRTQAALLAIREGLVPGPQ